MGNPAPTTPAPTTNTKAPTTAPTEPTEPTEPLPPPPGPCRLIYAPVRCVHDGKLSTVENECECPCTGTSIVFAQIEYALATVAVTPTTTTVTPPPPIAPSMCPKIRNPVCCGRGRVRKQDANSCMCWCDSETGGGTVISSWSCEPTDAGPAPTAWPPTEPAFEYKEIYRPVGCKGGNVPTTEENSCPCMQRGKCDRIGNMYSKWESGKPVHHMLWMC